MNFTFGRVYINIGKSFKEEFCKLNFDELIAYVAKCVGSYNGEVLFTKENNKEIVYPKRTKKCIIREANFFMSDLIQVPTEEDSMYSFVSFRQINRLNRALKKSYGYVSCYSMIILHIINQLILNNTPHEDLYDNRLIETLSKCIFHLVNNYYDEYRNDNLAHYLLDCYPKVKEEIMKKQNIYEAKQFPSIQKKNPKVVIDD